MLNRGRCPPLDIPKVANNMVYLGRFDECGEGTTTDTVLTMTTACHDDKERQANGSAGSHDGAGNSKVKVNTSIDEFHTRDEAPHHYRRTHETISDLKSRLHSRQCPQQRPQSLCARPRSSPVKFPPLHCATSAISVVTGADTNSSARVSTSASTTANAHYCSLSHSYEETLFRALPRGPLVPFAADLVISRPGSHGLCHVYRERLHLSAGLILPYTAGPLPFCCRHRLRTPLPLSRRRGVTLQLVIRHEETGVVGKVFLLRLDVGDMPERSQTLIRQKHYYHNSRDGQPVLQHALQLSIARGEGPGTTRLQGSIRLIFSFNQAATIGGGEWNGNGTGLGRNGGPETGSGSLSGGGGEAEVMSERLHIVTEYPLPGKYVPLLGPTLGAPRLSPHGAIH